MLNSDRDLTFELTYMIPNYRLVTGNSAFEGRLRKEIEVKSKKTSPTTFHNVEKLRMGLENDSIDELQGQADDEMRYFFARIKSLGSGVTFSSGQFERFSILEFREPLDSLMENLRTIPLDSANTATPVNGAHELLREFDSAYNPSRIDLSRIADTIHRGLAYALELCSFNTSIVQLKGFIESLARGMYPLTPHAAQRLLDAVGGTFSSEHLATCP